MTNERASKLERALEGLAEGDCEYWSDPAQMYRDKFVAAEQRIATLEAVLRELVHKLEMVEESHWFRNMFVVAAVHGARYEGPTWAPELTAAKAALAAQPAPAVDLRSRIVSMMTARGWSLEWIHRSAYLHLEAAELAEAVRGKRGDTLDESGDVLITLLALSPHSLPEIVAAAERKLADLTKRPPYAGEQLAQPAQERGVCPHRGEPKAAHVIPPGETRCVLCFLPAQESEGQR